MHPNPSMTPLSIDNSVQVLQTLQHDHLSTNNLYGSFNLGFHVRDDPQTVHQNRIQLLKTVQAEYPPIQKIHWLNQVHGNRVVDIDDFSMNLTPLSADAHFTTSTTVALAIMTADCVPVMISSSSGEVIAGVHAGWQGLANGIIANTIIAMQNKLNKKDTQYWQAWIGPCIAHQHYEVDDKIRTQVLAQLDTQLSKTTDTLTDEQRQRFFTSQPNKAGHYLADLATIAQVQLALCGLKLDNIYQSGLDSYSNNQFYSYRQQTERGLAATGRMATLIFKI